MFCSGLAGDLSRPVHLLPVRSTSNRPTSNECTYLSLRFLLWSHYTAFLVKAPAISLTPVRAAIILFCLWHMAAVALYALPDGARDPLTQHLRFRLQPLIRPYILLFSQWQQWNIFSPDPLRRVTTYTVEIDRGEQWHTLTAITPEAVPWLRHSDTFKLIDRLLSGPASTIPAIDHFLRMHCTQHGLPPGTHLRLVYHTAVLPLPANVLAPAQWRALRQQLMPMDGSEILCGWPGAGIGRSFPSS